jgi:hypothetical protein
VVAVRLRAGARRRDLSGVRLELRAEGQRPDTLTVRAGQSPGGEFLFGVGRSGDGAPALRRGGGSQAYRLRRTTAGQLLLKPPGGQERAIGQGQPAGLADGFELVVGDARTASRSGRPGRDGQARGQGGGPFGRRRVPGPRGPRPQGSTDRTGPRGGRARGDASAAPPRRGTPPPDPNF